MARQVPQILHPQGPQFPHPHWRSLLQPLSPFGIPHLQKSQRLPSAAPRMGMRQQLCKAALYLSASNPISRVHIPPHICEKRCRLDQALEAMLQRCHCRTMLGQVITRVCITVNANVQSSVSVEDVWAVVHTFAESDIMDSTSWLCRTDHLHCRIISNRRDYSNCFSERNRPFLQCSSVQESSSRLMSHWLASAC